MMLGLWAADKLGLAGAEAQAYAKDLVTADFEAPGGDNMGSNCDGNCTGGGITGVSCEGAGDVGTVIRAAGGME